MEKIAQNAKESPKSSFHVAGMLSAGKLRRIHRIVQSMKVDVNKHF